MDAQGNTNGSCTSTENMQQRLSACSSGAESDDDASRDHLPPVHGYVCIVHLCLGSKRIIQMKVSLSLALNFLPSASELRDRAGGP
jgi:hypothetical protein